MRQGRYYGVIDNHKTKRSTKQSILVYILRSMRHHVTTSLYPTSHSAVRLYNVTGDALHYDTFITHSCCLRSREGEFAVGDGRTSGLLAAGGSGEGSEMVVGIERHFYKNGGGLELVWY